MTIYHHIYKIEYPLYKNKTQKKPYR